MNLTPKEKSEAVARLVGIPINPPSKLEAHILEEGGRFWYYYQSQDADLHFSTFDFCLFEGVDSAQAAYVVKESAWWKNNPLTTYQSGGQWFALEIQQGASWRALPAMGNAEPSLIAHTVLSIGMNNIVGWMRGLVPEKKKGLRRVK